MSKHTVNAVTWCRVCDDYYSDSRIDVLKHIQAKHTLEDRLDALLYTGPEPEDTHAD